jgi:predicted NAD-dependent protein-ADP-ribosyltransferase YbiA (DUF1768 family)
MDKCSFFIPNKALFGSFPTQETVEALEKEGVRYFIDLTDYNETKTVPYVTHFTYIKYPIQDRRYPHNWKSFAQLIVYCSNILTNLKEDEKLYIHCKGGHGRSGIVVCCILCYHFHLSVEDALKYTSHCHSKRSFMKEKWRRIGSPQGKCQKDFIHRFFRPLYFVKPYQLGKTYGFHNMSPHSVYMEGVGTFPNAHLAFQYFKDPDNEAFVKGLQQGIYRKDLILSLNKAEWDEKKEDFMERVLLLKFQQHPHLKESLLHTALRPLIKISQDKFWGNGSYKYFFKGENRFGKLLEKIRTFFFLRQTFEGT